MIGLRLVFMNKNIRDQFYCSYIGNIVKFNNCELISKRDVEYSI